MGNGDSIGGVGKCCRALIGGDNKIGVFTVADDHALGVNDLSRHQIVRDGEQSPDEKAVAFGSFGKPRVAVDRWVRQMFGVEAPLGTGRNDHRILDPLCFHQAQYFGPVIIASVGPADRHDGDPVAAPAGEVDQFDVEDDARDPLLAEQVFGLAAFSSALTFIVAFGAVKAVTNFFAGTLSDRFGRKPVLIAGWLIAIPVPLLLIWAPSWGWVIVANVLLGVNQGLTWSTTVIMNRRELEFSASGIMGGQYPPEYVKHHIDRLHKPGALRLLDLEELEVNVFRGRSPQVGWQRVFGGQVAGQALVAAARTVDQEFHVHSLHAYFVQGGTPEEPIDLVVTTGDNLAHPLAVPPLLGAYAPLMGRPGLFVFGSNDYFGPRPKNPLAYFGGPSLLHREASDLPVEEWYRGTRFGPIGDGPDELHKSVLARTILKGYTPVEGWPTEHIPKKLEAAKAKYAEYLEHEVGNL